MVDILHDLAGPLLVTCPTFGDYDNEEVGADLIGHLAGSNGWSAQDRMKPLHYLRGFTADSYGGWVQVAGPLSGGGQFAQRLVALRNYDLVGATRKARRPSASTPLVRVASATAPSDGHRGGVHGVSAGPAPGVDGRSPGTVLRIHAQPRHRVATTT